MIKLTRINDSAIVINAEHIEFVEALPDTIVTMTNGQKILVKEPLDDVIERTKDYKRSIIKGPFFEV
ncbi:flagellar FlbD family protein [Candidatus Latescibacterota bacterium]